jgi:tRNA(Ile)-lysidine synthase
MLHRLKEKFSIALHAVYVNHNLRPDEIPQEIEFCRTLCQKLDVNLITKSIEVEAHAKESGLNKHEAARELRYRAFDEAAYEVDAQKIALAHNADDQVETIFMRLLRGTGPKGLSGMPAKRRHIIRPLIGVERADIEAFLEAEKISFVVDSSNLKTDYHRNRLRRTLMPVLRELNPSIAHTIMSTASIFQEEERYFDIVVTKTLMKLISRKRDTRIELFLTPMEGMEKVILRRVLRRAIEETKGLRGIGFVHIEEIISLIREGLSGDRIYLPKGIRVIKEYSVLVITSETPVKIGVYSIQPPCDVAIREAGVVIRATFKEKTEDIGDGKTSALLDADIMKFPLIVRPRAVGDFFFPLGLGKRKKVQDFFVDEKVPRDERDSVPIILSEDDIVWIAGHRPDERYRASEKTNKFLKLDILKGNF